MARPRTTKELHRLQIQTVAFMNALRLRVGAQNPSQFSDWINHVSEPLGWSDMKDSNKWYKYFRGNVSQVPVRMLRLLKEIFPDASNLFHEGPERVWDAMWTEDVRALWHICNFSGYEYKNQNEAESTCFMGNTLKFSETAYNFECNLILESKSHGDIDFRLFTESVALYRIHKIINEIHRTDEIGPYRCVKMCLDTQKVTNELKALGVYNFVHDEIISTEISRLNSEPCYRASVGTSDVARYALDPFSHCSITERMEVLRIN